MSGSAARRRARALGLLAVAVFAVHALLLGVIAPAWFDPDHDALPSPPVLSVRSVVVPPPAPPAATEVPRGPEATVATVPPKATRPTAPVASAPLPPPEPAAAATAPPVEAAVLPAAAVDTPLAVAALSAEATPPARAAELPTYATRPPAAGQWRYELQRGIATGEALLSWAPEADGRYTLQLEGRIGGVTVLDWVSRGAMDGAGLAPERFVIRRRGRDSQAANFQRDAGKVTFSGPTHELPLWAGVQDRLSWMVQMAAIVQAAPERFGAGSTLTLMVVGARGGADLWRFDVVGTEDALGRGTLKLVRQARRPHDTQVEVWLDAARAYMPLRALLTQPDGGAPLELRSAPDRQAPTSTGP